MSLSMQHRRHVAASRVSVTTKTETNLPTTRTTHGVTWTTINSRRRRVRRVRPRADDTRTHAMSNLKRSGRAVGVTARGGHPPVGVRRSRVVPTTSGTHHGPQLPRRRLRHHGPRGGQGRRGREDQRRPSRSTTSRAPAAPPAWPSTVDSKGKDGELMLMGLGVVGAVYTNQSGEHADRHDADRPADQRARHRRRPGRLAVRDHRRARRGLEEVARRLHRRAAVPRPAVPTTCAAHLTADRDRRDPKRGQLRRVRRRRRAAGRACSAARSRRACPASASTRTRSQAGAAARAGA